MLVVVLIAVMQLILIFTSAHLVMSSDQFIETDACSVVHTALAPQSIGRAVHQSLNSKFRSIIDASTLDALFDFAWRWRPT